MGRKLLFIAYYSDPQSKTFGNARQSAIRAGYSQAYADNISHLRPSWLSKELKKPMDSGLLCKAHENLTRYLDLNVQLSPDMTPEERREAINLLVLEQKATLFVLRERRRAEEKYENTPIKAQVFYHTTS